MTHFTASDRELLSRPLQAMITVAPKGDRWPAPRPVWFELTDADEIQLFSFASTPRVARVRETPRASVVVTAPVGEPEQWVSIEGAVTVHDDGAFDLADRRHGCTTRASRRSSLCWTSGATPIWCAS